MTTIQIITLIGSLAAIIASIINGIFSYRVSKSTARWKEMSDIAFF
jgi:hypothetical protein